MNKAQLIEKVAAKSDFSRSQIETLLSTTLATIQAELSSGGEVKLVGFGTFSIQNRKPRPGRNPKTGQTMTIPGSKVPHFKAGKELKESVK